VESKTCFQALDTIKARASPPLRRSIERSVLISFSSYQVFRLNAFNEPTDRKRMPNVAGVIDDAPPMLAVFM
jgi:hypothetical protein